MPRIHTYFIIAHLGGWLLFLGMPLVFIINNGNATVLQVLLSPYYWLCFAAFAAIFYLHIYLLVPLLYYRQKKAYYFLSVTLILLFILCFRPFDRLFSQWNHQPVNQQREMLPQQSGVHIPPPATARMPPPAPPQEEIIPQPAHVMRVDIISLFMLLVCLAVGFTVDTFQRLRITAQQAAKAEADKINAELAALKAQINPHFLFNTLNNLYSLALTNSHATADAILKLSNIMRYVTDEVHEDFVPLQNEADCINDFIDLQRLRLSSKVHIDYTMQGEITGKKIPPLLFITFVENIFKYGISNHLPSTIVIHIISKQNEIDFFCSNQVFDQKTAPRKGTGIINAQKRLEHLYAGRYSLAINAENNLYLVSLQLQN